MKWFAQFASEYFDVVPQNVLDIGCNDGTQLNYFSDLGAQTFGIDPAQNLHTISSKRHRVICDFFNTKTASQFAKAYGKMDCVVAQNSFAHNPDPLAYLIALKDVISDNGLFFIQTSQADMVLNNEFDTIYHEHVNFYNVNSMNELCKRAGYHLVDVVKTPIHGTSYVFVLSPKQSKPNRINNLLALESTAGLTNITTYYKWANTATQTVKQLYNECDILKNQMHCILVGYGAAAKGNTLLNFADLQLDMIIDDNPMKQGLYSPGKHIPVVSIESLSAISAHQPIVFVPLAWNFYKEIKDKILAKRNNPIDKFIKYFPKVKVECLN
jgi:SAM-dependent methyltransferase